MQETLVWSVPAALKRIRAFSVTAVTVWSGV